MAAFLVLSTALAFLAGNRASLLAVLIAASLLVGIYYVAVGRWDQALLYGVSVQGAYLLGLLVRAYRR